MQLRPTWRGYVGHCLAMVSMVAMVAFLVFGPLTASAQAINHAPIINSKPVTAVLAGAAYSYQLTAFDSDNDTVAFSLTTQPEGMTLANSQISWQPTKAGTYNVVAQASDAKNGYDSQSWQISVSVAEVASVIITPNDRPTVVEIGQTKQFSVTVADAYQNPIANPTIAWTTDAAVGTVSTTGLFTPTHGGTGFVAAQVGAVKASIGVIAKDTRTDQVTASTTNSTSDTNTAASIVNNVNKSTNKNSNINTNTGEVISAEANTNTQSTESTTTAACTNPSRKLIVFILVIYTIILAIYYSYERRHQNNGWWIFPFLVTFIGVIIYYKYFCAETYLWWPWVLVGIGVILTLYYKFRRHTPDTKQSELPF